MTPMNGNTAPALPAPSDRVKVILANDSRLLRQMLGRVLGKAAHVEVVAEVDNLRELAATAQRTGAQWIIVSLAPESEIPNSVVALLQGQSTTHVLAMAADGSATRVLTMEPREQQVHILSVAQILSLLQTQADPSPLPNREG